MFGLIPSLLRISWMYSRAGDEKLFYTETLRCVKLQALSLWGSLDGLGAKRFFLEPFNNIPAIYMPLHYSTVLHCDTSFLAIVV